MSIEESGNKGIVYGYLGNKPDISWHERDVNSGLLLTDVISLRSRGVTVFVMDMSGSLGNICQRLGGEAIKLNKYKPQKSDLFASCEDTLTIFDFKDLLDDMPFMSKALHNLLLMIMLQFANRKREGKFVFFISDERVMKGLGSWQDTGLDYFKELDSMLKKYGGSLISRFQDTSNFDEKYAEYFRLVT